MIVNGISAARLYAEGKREMRWYRMEKKVERYVDTGYQCIYYQFILTYKSPSLKCKNWKYLSIQMSEFLRIKSLEMNSWFFFHWNSSVAHIHSPLLINHSSLTWKQLFLLSVTSVWRRKSRNSRQWYFQIMCFFKRDGMPEYLHWIIRQEKASDIN